MSLVGAFRKCKGTLGIGPFQLETVSLAALYALYISTDFGARARYTAM